MVYRILGAISLGIGGIFGVVALLVLLPFIDNFNTSLLVLCGVFGVLAYVFLAIGWQLFHPPGSGRKGSAEEATVEEVAGRSPVSPGAGSSVVAEVGVERAAVVENDETESTDVDSVAVLEVDEDVAAGEHPSSPNGSRSDHTHVSTGSGFKKPGSPVPHK
jgi:hypothetical protein